MLRRGFYLFDNFVNHPQVLPYALFGQLAGFTYFVGEGVRHAIGGEFIPFYLTGAGETKAFRGSMKRKPSTFSEAVGYKKKQKTSAWKPQAAPTPAPSIAAPTPAPSTAAQASTMGNPMGQEDAVKPVGSVSNYAPDYFTFKGKSVHSFSHSGATVNTTTGAVGTDAALGYRDYRLNSASDPNLTTTGTGTYNTMVNGFEIWKTYYDYYRVLGTKVKLTFMKREYILDAVQLDGTSAITSALGASYYNGFPWMVGFVADPSNRLGSYFTGKLFSDIVVGKHQHMEWLQHGRLTMDYEYTPEAWDRSIETAQEDGLWTAVSANPSCIDCLKVIVAPFSDRNAGFIDVIVEIEQTVQMRQMNDATLQGEYANTGTVVAGG